MVLGSRRLLTLCASGREVGGLGEAVCEGQGQPGQLCGAAKSARVIPAGKQIILEAGQVNLCCWTGCSLPWDAPSLQCVGRGT